MADGMVSGVNGSPFRYAVATSGPFPEGMGLAARLIMKRWVHPIPGWIAVALAVGCGCASSVKEATKGATTGTTEAMEEPENRQRVLSTVESPEIQAAVRDLAADATSGAASVITDEKSAEQIRRFAVEVARAAASAAVDAALTQTSSPENQRRMQQSAVTMAESVTQASMSRLADDLPRTVGPAMGQVVRDDVAPSLRQLASSPDTRAAFSSAIYEAARQAVLGSNEATAELERSKPKKGLLARASSAMTEGGLVLGVAFVVLLATIVVLLLALLRARSEVTRYLAMHTHDEQRPYGPGPGGTHQPA